MKHQHRRNAVRAVGILAALGLVTGLAGCSGGATTATSSVDPNAAEVNPPGDIPDDQVFVTWTDPSGAFSVDVPEGWSQEVSDGAVTFTDKLNSVRVESMPATTPPTTDSVAGELTAVEADAGYRAGDVTTVTRTGGDAVLATYQVDSAPGAVTGKIIPDAVERYEFYRDGTAVVLTLSGPVGADNVDPWRIVSDSFAWS